MQVELSWFQMEWQSLATCITTTHSGHLVPTKTAALHVCSPYYQNLTPPHTHTQQSSPFSYYPNNESRNVNHFLLSREKEFSSAEHGSDIINGTSQGTRLRECVLIGFHQLWGERLLVSYSLWKKDKKAERQGERKETERKKRGITNSSSHTWEYTLWNVLTAFLPRNIALKFL